VTTKNLRNPPSSFGAAGFVLLGAFLIQWSAAIIQPAFALIGPAASSGWRFLAGAVALLFVARPRIRSWTSKQWTGVFALGLSSAFMNLCFYQAIQRIPLGTAVAIEYLGPFLVAALGKRTWRHFGFVALASLGVLALARPGGNLTLVGALFAAGSGVGWAAYALSSHRLGDVTDGFGGLAVAMTVASVATFGFLAPSLTHVVSSPGLLFRVALVGVMATALGFGAEMQALRRVKPSVVGVLLALDPAVAFLVGFVILRQTVKPLDFVGLVCVVVSGIGVTLDATRVMLEPAR